MKFIKMFVKLFAHDSTLLNVITTFDICVFNNMCRTIKLKMNLTHPNIYNEIIALTIYTKLKKI